MGCENYTRQTTRLQNRIVLVLLAVLLTVPVACNSTLPPPVPPPHLGVTLSVSCPSAVADLVRARAQVWKDRQQAHVRISAHDLAKGPASDADVWVIAPAELPHWAAAGGLVELPKALTERGKSFEWDGLLPQYREQLLLWESGRAFGVPLAGEAPICVYRSDLFADRKIQEAYRDWQVKRNDARKARKQPPLSISELRAPLTWAEVADQAEFFRDHRGKPSLPPLPASEAALDRLFYSIAAPHARRAVPTDEPVGEDHRGEVFSFHYDEQTGSPRIANAGFAAALDLLKRLQACSPSRPVARPEMSFFQGDAVLCMTDASWLPRFQSRAALRDRFGVCQIPGTDRYFGAKRQWVYLKSSTNRVPYLGGAGWLAVVPKGAKHPEAALDLLAEMAGPSGSLQTALEPDWGPTRTEHLLRERWDAYDLDVARTKALKVVLNQTLLQHGIKNPVLCLRIPDQASHRTALVAQLRLALLKGKESEKALADAAARWSELDAKRGKEAHLRDYRISLGLLGH